MKSHIAVLHSHKLFIASAIQNKRTNLPPKQSHMWLFPSLTSPREAGASQHDLPGHWRSLLHQNLPSASGPFGTRGGGGDIAQTCLQLGCSRHRPLAWNVSRAGDNLPGFLLSRHKGTPAKGQLCYGHIHEGDLELQIARTLTHTHAYTQNQLLRSAFDF